MSLNFTFLRNTSLLRLFSCKKIYPRCKTTCSIPIRNVHHTASAELDLSYLCDVKNTNEIEENIKKRDSNANINLVHKLYNKYNSSKNEKDWNAFLIEALKIPNKTLHHRDENETVKIVGSPNTTAYKEFNTITKQHNWCRTENLGNLVGHRGYYFMGELAELEQALIRLVLRRLIKEGFKLVSVPDILSSEAIENCGMPTKGERNQVYKLDDRHGPELCLSGTAEMALAAMLTNTTISRSDLPVRLAAVSRCYRAETSSIAEERGVYRVHQFTKVEMFGVTGGHFEASQKLQNEFIKLQIDIFTSLGLHFRLLDMASNELGNPAVRKLDLESWMPGRKQWGELCSCSDCGDYQSRRHNLKLDDNTFAHTVNGTACAIPRTLMAIIETHQNKDGTVNLPKPLHNIMNRDKLGLKLNKMPNMKYIKSIHN